MSRNLITQALGSPIRSHLLVRCRWSPALLSCLAFFLAKPAGAADTLDLSGNWRFAIDRRNEGVAQAWFDRTLADRIKLPGILQAQGYGDDISAATPWVLSLYDKNWAEREDYKQHAAPGKVRVPFLSQPQKHYLGAAWYQRDIDIAPAWRGKRVVLLLERPHWGSTVWFDDREVGTRLSDELSARRPQRFRFARHELERHRRQGRVARHQSGLDRRRPGVSESA
jgi:beta-galactosidase